MLKIHRWLWCAGALWMLNPSASAQGPLILISVDGLRPDAIDASRTPQLDVLIAEGSYSPYALCDIPTSTLPNHTTMLTGRTVSEHGVRFNSEVDGTIELRTIHDECADAGLRSGFYVSKSKLRFLAHSESLEVVVVDSDTTSLVDAAIAQLLDDPLDLMFLHIRDPDSAGHSSGWMSPEYLSAVEQVDQLIGRIVAALGEAGLEEAHLVITADHGGQGLVHFLNVPEVRFIPWIAWGPRVAAGRTLCGEVMQADTAATVLTLLEVPVPASYVGRVVTEALATSPQAPCEPLAPELGAACGVLWAPVFAVLLLQLVWIWRRRFRGSKG